MPSTYSLDSTGCALNIYIMQIVDKRSITFLEKVTLGFEELQKQMS